MGWRYLYLAAGSLVLVLSFARVLLIRFHETPKYLLSRGRDEEVVAFLHELAKTYNRPCDLTLEDLQACGETTTLATTSTTTSDATTGKSLLAELLANFRGLFQTRSLTKSVTLIWISWMLIGLSYPLFYLYLPEYLASRNISENHKDATLEQHSSTVWRDYTLTNLMAIPAPLLAGWMGQPRRRSLGRKWIMILGALLAGPSLYPIFPSIPLFYNIQIVGKLLTAMQSHSLLLHSMHTLHNPPPNPRLELRHLVLHQHLLQHFIRLDARDDADRASGDGEWDCAGAEQGYGDCGCGGCVGVGGGGDGVAACLLRVAWAGGFGGGFSLIEGGRGGREGKREGVERGD